jgi:hypothetical protein
MDSQSIVLSHHKIGLSGEAIYSSRLAVTTPMSSARASLSFDIEPLSELEFACTAACCASA